MFEHESNLKQLCSVISLTQNVITCCTQQGVYN